MDAVWKLVSDPYNLPRWWPRTSRVENVEGGGGRRTRWTKVLETAEGRGVRADFRCVSSAEEERYVWEQELAGTPFERHLKGLRVEVGAAGAKRRHRGQRRRGADAEGDVEAGLADDAARPRRRSSTKRSTGSSGRWDEPVQLFLFVAQGQKGTGDMTPRRDAKWWGWGDPAVEPALDEQALGVLRERIGELEPWPLARELEDFELPAPRRRCRGRWSRRWGRRTSSPATRTGCATRPGAATSTWRGCATGPWRTLPTRW